MKLLRYIAGDEVRPGMLDADGAIRDLASIVVDIDDYTVSPEGLALIGAIVAEFFGSPVRGMGFRISTSVGQLALDLVWAEIVVAAIAGSAFYGAMSLIERAVTFWHPSQRR